MAGDWIKICHVTPDKPEVWKMAQILNIDPDSVVGKLIRIWIWADQQTIDGNARSVTLPLLNRLSGVTGFAETMLLDDVGWLKKDENGSFYFPNFDDHNGETAKKRALSNKRQAKYRAGLGGGVTDVSQISNAASVTKTSTREEKRREDLKDTCQNGHDFDQPPKPPKSPQCPYRQILDLYHAILPELTMVRSFDSGDERWKALGDRWRQDKRHQSLEFWESLFNTVANTPFYLGQNNRGWKADFRWIVKRSNFTKIIEGTHRDIGNRA